MLLVSEHFRSCYWFQIMLLVSDHAIGFRTFQIVLLVSDHAIVVDYWFQVQDAVQLKYSHLSTSESMLQWTERLTTYYLKSPKY